MQLCPDITHAIIAAIGSAELKSASSSTMWADLPPSSSSVFFTVGAPAARIARPVAVEPGEGDHVHPRVGRQRRAHLVGVGDHDVEHPGGDVGLLGDDAAVARCPTTG